MSIQLIKYNFSWGLPTPWHRNPPSRIHTEGGIFDPTLRSQRVFPGASRPRTPARGGIRPWGYPPVGVLLVLFGRFFNFLIFLFFLKFFIFFFFFK